MGVVVSGVCINDVLKSETVSVWPFQVVQTLDLGSSLVVDGLEVRELV